MIICAKTVKMEIANTDCVRTRSYTKEVKVKRYGDRGGHGAAEGACGAGSGSSLSALRPGMVSVPARVTKVRCVRCPEDSVSRRLSNTALVCGSERRNTVRGPVTQEETRRLLTWMWPGQRRRGKCTRAAAVRHYRYWGQAPVVRVRER